MPASRLHPGGRSFQLSIGALHISGELRHKRSLTSSRTSTAFSAGVGRGADTDGPGRETLESLRFRSPLTPVQLLGILKAHRL